MLLFLLPVPLLLLIRSYSLTVFVVYVLYVQYGGHPDVQLPVFPLGTQGRRL